MALVRTPWIGRRALIAGAAASAGMLLAPPLITQAQDRFVRTPRQTEGPFYPTDWSGDADNDLVMVQGGEAKAMGLVTHVRGRVLDPAGQPIPGASVEIWQCDARGIYRHPADERGSRRHDAAFQGRGRSASDAGGRYSFRTIRPVAYPGRTPHIHFKIVAPGRSQLVTQMYVFGEPQNASDGVLNRVADRRQRESVIVRLDPADAIEPGSLAGTFDIVLG
jgi:protocatechuate 3,4-dioxygenase, beta subunit